MALRRLVEIIPNVWVARSRRYQSATTVLLDGHGGALVVDPNWDADELAAIPQDLADLGVTCVAGLATHLHYDQSPRRAPQGRNRRWLTTAGDNGTSARSLRRSRRQGHQPEVG